MVRTCSVKGCTERLKKGGISFHSFPVYEDRTQKWLKAIHREDYQPSASAAVCGRHFRKEDYVTHFGSRRLKEDAVPSVALAFHQPRPKTPTRVIAKTVTIPVASQRTDEKTAEDSAVKCENEPQDGEVKFKVEDLSDVTHTLLTSELIIKTEPEDEIASLASNDVRRVSKHAANNVKCFRFMNTQKRKSKGKSQFGTYGNYKLEQIKNEKARRVLQCANRHIFRQNQMLKCLRSRQYRLIKRMRILKQIIEILNKNS